MIKRWLPMRRFLLIRSASVIAAWWSSLPFVVLLNFCFVTAPALGVENADIDALELPRADSVIDAAYRYCRHAAGSDVVLFGTGNLDHVRANIDSILSPPLPTADVERLETLFGALIGIGLDRPDKVR